MKNIRFARFEGSLVFLAEEAVFEFSMCLPKNGNGAVTILHGSSRDPNDENEAYDVDEQMALSSVDFFPAF